MDGMTFKTIDAALTRLDLAGYRPVTPAEVVLDGLGDAWIVVRTGRRYMLMQVDVVAQGAGVYSIEVNSVECTSVAERTAAGRLLLYTRAPAKTAGDNMPADPFGDTPAHAAAHTSAVELMTMLGTYTDAGFTRAEAFELVRTYHQTELDHDAQHCLIAHQKDEGDDDGPGDGAG